VSVSKGQTNFSAGFSNRFVLLMMVLILLPAGFPLYAKSRPAKASVNTDPDYVLALAAANRFLYAWQAEDQENGILMMTDTAKHRTSEERLQSFFAPGAGVQQTYEIGRGRRLHAGQYSFPVTLFACTDGNPARTSHPRSSEIVVVKAGEHDWAVDKLP
jgi:hypothetical protein